MAWYGGSGDLDFDDQAAWIALAVLGAVIAAAGGALWLLTGLAMVARERRSVQACIAALYGTSAAEVDEINRTAANAVHVTADGMRRYHRPSCDVVRGKPVRPIAGPRNEDLLACGMCQS
ncbi:hypothetical protein [Sporichthya brevicatena]|uniref:hypothetical protein n=1 Tax=Sporichthya brevicatena TaxID=171442 RepID=UPI0031D840F6